MAYLGRPGDPGYKPFGGAAIQADPRQQYVLKGAVSPPPPAGQYPTFGGGQPPPAGFAPPPSAGPRPLGAHIVASDNLGVAPPQPRSPYGTSSNPYERQNQARINAATGNAGGASQPRPMAGTRPLREHIVASDNLGGNSGTLYPGASGQPPASGGNTITQPGIGTYQTGITAGQLPQQSINESLSRLRPSSNLTANAPYGTAMNRQQQSESNTMLQDALRSGFYENRNELDRNSAYQQAQMQLGFDRARSDAALGGFGNLYSQESGRVSNDAARRSMLLDLIGALTGGMDLGLGG